MNLNIVIDVLVFVAVVLCVMLIERRMGAGLAIRRRLKDDVGDAKGTDAKAPPRGSLVRTQDPRNPVLAWVQRSTLQDPEERSKLRRDLDQAGFEAQAAPAIDVMLRFGLAVLLPIGFILSQRLLGTTITGPKLVFVTVVLCVAGLITPRAVLDNRAGARRAQIENEFPDVLDLMVVCVESGLGLEGAVLRVGQETVRSHASVAREFLQVSQELRAGRTRAEALRNMGERTQVDRIKAFVALLVQTDTLGGSIAQSLRTYSAEMRHHRMLRAEEKAMRLPVLMTVPLVVCILPVIITAVMLPPVIDAIHAFAPK